MTFCLADTSPKDWHRTEFTNDYLEAVSNYIERTGAVANLSGAVTYGIMEHMYGPFTAKVAFENQEEFETFKAWFEKTEHIKLDNVVYVPMNGSLIEELLKS